MAVLNDFNIKRLLDFRKGLLNIPADELSHQSMQDFLVTNRGAVDAVGAYNTIIHRLQPYQGVADRKVLEALREELVGILENQIHIAGGTISQPGISEATGSAFGTSTAEGVGASIAAAIGNSPSKSEGADVANFQGLVSDPRRFELVEARLLALEETFRQVRETPIGPGHNRGPELVSSEDEHEIDSLIRLLREQRPGAGVVKRQELLEATHKAAKVADKIKEYTDDFLKAGSKTAGEEFGKQIVRVPFWLALWSALTLVVDAVFSWLR